MNPKTRNRNRGAFVVVLLVSLWLPQSGACGAGRDAAIMQSVERMRRSLVRITAVSESPGTGRLEKQLSSGSGAIISEEGHIITNHHVAGRGRRLLCRLYDGEEVDARLVATDPLTDLAIVQIDLSRRKNKEKLRPARLGNSDSLKVGEVILAMGCPAGVSQSVTQGIVSNTQLMLPSLSQAELWEEGEAVGSVVRWIGHDAVIFPGNSGGPLVNTRGEIVGINEVVLGSLGGAIPVNLAKQVAAELIKHGRVDRSWTGIEGQPRPKNMGLERGVLVGGVLPESPAALAGLEAGDVLLVYDGTPVDARIPEDLPAFNRLILSTPVGKRVKISALRQGRPMTFEFVTELRGKAQGDEAELHEWGIVGRDLTRLSALQRQRSDTNGVLVASLGLASAAANAKPAIAIGDLIVEVAGEPVQGTAHLQAITDRLLEGVPDRRPVLVRFDRGRVRYLTVVRIGQDPKRPEIVQSRKPGLSTELQALSPDLAEALGAKDLGGALVTLVYPGRSAERAGFRQGDVLVKFDGDTVRCERPGDIDDLYARVRRYRIGREVECEVIRQGAPVTLTLKLEEDLQTAEERQRYEDDVFDLTMERLTELDRIYRNLPADAEGVAVVEVETGGWAQLAGLRGGDLVVAIDGTPTPDVGAAERQLKQAAAARAPRVVFFIRRGIHTRFVELAPDWPRSDEADGASRSTLSRTSLKAKP